MKLTKKLMAIVMVIAILASLAVTAFAVDDTSTVDKTDVTITNAVPGATYNAYKLLSVTTSLLSNCTHNVSNGDSHLSTCYAVAYYVNEKYADILNEIVPDADPDDPTPNTDTVVYEYILAQSSAEAIRTFADNAYSSISASSPTVDPDMTISLDSSAEATSVTFSNMDQGYWLIVEELSEGHDGAHSLVMLDTVGSRDISISTKRQEPTMIKRVRDNGMSYDHGADIAIGDKAEFLIRSDVPDPTGYATYTYVIHDQMDSALTFNRDVKIRKNVVDTGDVLDPSYYTVHYGTEYSCTDNCTFHIKVNIKEAVADKKLQSGDRLYISYTATLNEKATVYSVEKGEGQTDRNFGNPNTAYLEYSCNPYNDTASSSETAKTVPETVYVYTFPITVNKIDSADVRLDGAKFKLSLSSNLGESEVSDNSKFLPMLEKGNNTYLVVPKGYTPKEDETPVYEFSAGSTVLQGFDDQVDYYLYETKAPDGYNELAAPVHIKFYADYVSGTENFSDGYPYVSVNSGAANPGLYANIVNQTGTELPSTGGIGTTIFYVAGGLLVVAAIVLLITRKRMSAES